VAAGSSKACCYARGSFPLKRDRWEAMQQQSGGRGRLNMGVLLKVQPDGCKTLGAWRERQLVALRMKGQAHKATAGLLFDYSKHGGSGPIS